MDKQELLKYIKEYIKENLTINVECVGGEYGSKTYFKFELKIEDEGISTGYMDIEQVNKIDILL